MLVDGGWLMIEKGIVLSCVLGIMQYNPWAGKSN